MKVIDINLTSAEEKRVLDYITRRALVSLGDLKTTSDPEYENLLEREYFFYLLLGILNNENDYLNARKAHDYVDALGYDLDEDELVDRSQEIRLKCKLELFALSIALDLLYNGNEDPSVVFAKVRQLLE